MSEKVKLTVYSAHSKATPPNGYDNYDKGQVISCSVTSPVTENGIDWKCNGWQGTGSVPKQGEGPQVSFPLTEDSTITWIWKRQLYTLSLAQWTTIITFIVIVALSVGMYEAKYALPMVVFAGAIGGLLHEIVQSQGKFILPTMDNGNFCLGGLVGIIIGAIAGFILYQGLSLSSSAVSGMLFSQAFLSGLAAKGVTDAVQPPPPKSNNGKQQQRQEQQAASS